MNFLYPQFLYGLAALAIPIIIHLFNFRRTKKVFFSSNRFLRNIKESNSSRLRLKHWLILAARLLFIFFLVIAFAQPYFPTEEGRPAGLVKIYLDNSYSMSNETAEDVSALDKALAHVQAIVAQYPKHTRYRLITNEFSLASERLISHEALLDDLTEIKLSPVTRSMEEIISRMNMDNKMPSKESSDNFIISDFQKSTSAHTQQLRLDSSERYYLIPIDFMSTANVFVDSVYLSNPFLLADNTNSIKIRLRNTGKAAADNIILKLLVNDAQVATAGVNINGQSTATVSFDINFALEERNRCLISFEDFPVTYDNDFYFSLNTAPKIDILEISGENASEVLSKVYANEALFNFSRYNINNLDYNLIKEADLVLLNEIQAYNNAIVPYLQDYVEQGGTVVLIFGEAPDLGELAFLRLPEPLQVTDTKNISLQPMGPPDLSNPFFANIFEDVDDRIEMPSAYNTVTWRSAGLDILEHKNGTPYISRSVKDNIYYIGSPLKDQYTNFHKQALIVPIMYRLAALSQSFNDQLYFYINDAQLTIKKEDITPQDVLKLKNETEEIIPSQFISGNRVFIEVPKYTLNPGFYTLVKGESMEKVLAFNYNKEESKLTQFSRKELNRLFGEAPTLYEEGSIEAFKNELKDRHEGKELWKICLILALSFLLAEVALIRLL